MNRNTRIDPKKLGVGSKVAFKPLSIMGLHDGVVIGHDKYGLPIISSFAQLEWHSSAEKLTNLRHPDYIIKEVYEIVERAPMPAGLKDETIDPKAYIRPPPEKPKPVAKKAAKKTPKKEEKNVKSGKQPKKTAGDSKSASAGKAKKKKF